MSKTHSVFHRAITQETTSEFSLCCKLFEIWSRELVHYWQLNLSTKNFLSSQKINRQISVIVSFISSKTIVYSKIMIFRTYLIVCDFISHSVTVGAWHQKPYFVISSFTTDFDSKLPLLVKLCGLFHRFGSSVCQWWFDLRILCYSFWTHQFYKESHKTKLVLCSSLIQFRLSMFNSNYLTCLKSHKKFRRG